MTTNKNRIRFQRGKSRKSHRGPDGAGRAASLLRALAVAAGAALVIGCLSPARGITGEAPVAEPGPAGVPAADSTASLHVVTLPAGLLVFVGGEPVGRSPLLLNGLPPRRVRVRVLRDDPRRYDHDRDEADVSLAAGQTAEAYFDLRPPLVLETGPRGADVAARQRGVPGDSLLGAAPLLLPRVLLPGRLFLIQHACCADTTVSGSDLLRLAEEAGTARVSLRAIPRSVVSPPTGTPIYRRPWFQWGLVAAGAGLTGASALLKREGDRWYDRYLGSSDRRVLGEYFDRAVHYDHLSLAALGVGQALFTGGLVLLVSHSSR
ncbi:MAG TPA: hypothetical protein VID50_07680 [Candidatus Eisenbacteria bacterium]